MKEDGTFVLNLMMTICTIAMLLISVSTCNSVIKVDGLNDIVLAQQKVQEELVSITSNQTEQSKKFLKIIGELQTNNVKIDSNNSQNSLLITETMKLVKQNSYQTKELIELNSVVLKSVNQSKINQSILTESLQESKFANKGYDETKFYFINEYLTQIQKTKEAYYSYYSKKHLRDEVINSKGKVTYPIGKEKEADIGDELGELILALNNLDSKLDVLMTLTKSIQNTRLNQLTNQQVQLLKKLKHNLEKYPIYESKGIIMYKHFNQWDSTNLEMITIFSNLK